MYELKTHYPGRFAGRYLCGQSAAGERFAAEGSEPTCSQCRGSARRREGVSSQAIRHSGADGAPFCGAARGVLAEADQEVTCGRCAARLTALTRRRTARNRDETIRELRAELSAMTEERDRLQREAYREDEPS